MSTVTNAPYSISNPCLLLISLNLSSFSLELSPIFLRRIEIEKDVLVTPQLDFNFIHQSIHTLYKDTGYDGLGAELFGILLEVDVAQAEGDWALEDQAVGAFWGLNEEYRRWGRSGRTGTAAVWR